MRPTVSQRSNRTIQIIVVVLILLTAVIVGWLWRAHNTAHNDMTSSYSASSAAEQYYGCFDQAGKSLDISNDACTYEGKTYAAPTSFSLAAVRGYNKLSFEASAYVLNAGKQYFTACRQAGGIAEITIYDVKQNSFILMGLGGTCQNASYQILYNNNGAWNPIATSTSATFSCSTVNQYKVPASLLTTVGYPATCLESDGTTGSYVTTT